MGLDFSKVLKLDVETTGRCNLRCPLCVSQAERGTYPVQDVDVEKLKRLVRQFPNLELITLGGVCSEPTLHPKLLELLAWLRAQPFNVELYTNASQHEPAWWGKLAQAVGSRCLTVFSIAGTTQELHGKYRVGSSLASVLANLEAFASQSHNYLLQYLRFEYNRGDDFSQLQKRFPNFTVVDTDSCFERRNPHSLSFNSGVCMEKTKSFRYRRLLSYCMRDGLELACFAEDNQSAYADTRCEVWPCAAFRGNLVPNSCREIEAMRLSCCLECDKRAREFLEKAGTDAYFMC